MKYIKIFENYLRDTASDLYGKNYKKEYINKYDDIKKAFNIDKEDIANIFQDFLDLYPDLVYYCGFNKGSKRSKREELLFGKDIDTAEISFVRNCDPDDCYSMTKYRYPISKELKDQINGRLSDFGLKLKMESNYWPYSYHKIIFKILKK